MRGNNTIWYNNNNNNFIKERNVNYIEDRLRIVADNNKTDNHAGIVWNDAGNIKEYYVFYVQRTIR